MGLSTFTTILLFIVCLAGGIAIGFLIGRYLRTAPGLPLEEEEKEETVSSGKETEMAKPADPALLRVGRVRKKGLWVEMGGQRWETASDSPPEKHQELGTLIQDLSTWLEPPASPAPDMEAYVPKPAQNSPFSRSFSPRRNAKKESSPIGVIVPPGNPASMVTQIDAILQNKLVGTPFSKLDIHLLENPTGEVIVQVGAIKHTGIESIPNREIQALIRQSVEEWEKTTH